MIDGIARVNTHATIRKPSVMPKRALSSGDTAGRSGRPAVVDALVAITSEPVVTGSPVLAGSPRLP